MDRLNEIMYRLGRIEGKLDLVAQGVKGLLKDAENWEDVDVETDSSEVPRG
jgi:hypothetical protein